MAFLTGAEPGSFLLLHLSYAKVKYSALKAQRHGNNGPS